ncbi:MFS transporter [Fundicoccus sp. Sow4_H7]|uniref:MFS transporter n=1 Tax=Fundicoccus sp. Sow4_H7 TaxID=3438784 RepID=UPI003F8EC93F
MKNASFFSRLSSNEKYIVKCMYYVFAVNGLYAMIMGPLLPYISEAYQLSNTVSGSLISAHYTGNLLSSFIAGILPAYIGRKNSVVLLSSFVVAGFLLMIVTGNPFLLLLSFFFTGISRGSISNFNNATMSEITDGNSGALSFMHAVFAIGALIAPYVVVGSVSMLGSNGWRLAAVIIIILTVISIILFSRMKLDEKATEKKSPLSYSFMKKKTFWILASILFFYLCAEATINGWLVKYFVDLEIFTIAYSQFLASLLWIGILIGRLVVSAIGHRFTNKQILYVLSAVTTVLFIVLLTSRDSIIITLAIFGLGLSMAGIYPTTIAATGGFIKEYPMAMGILLVLGGLGSILMPIITGALADQFGILFGMAAIVVALALLIIFVFAYDLDSRNKE